MFENAIKAQKFGIGLVLLSLVAACSAVEELDTEADLKAIYRLHQKDASASQEKDFDTLLTLLSDDIVFMPPGEDFLRGLDAARDRQRQYRDQLAGIEILEYRFEFQEVVVTGDYAFDWGTSIGRLLTPEGEEVEQRSKFLRILKRQPNGEWKVHRTMWNALPLKGGS